MRAHALFGSIAAAVVALSAGCTASTDTSTWEDGPLGDNVMSFEEYLERAVTFYDPATDKYIVEGDIGLHGLDAVRAFYERSIVQPGALTQSNCKYSTATTCTTNKSVKWSTTDKSNITYCVNWAAGKYSDLVTAMAAATRSWEAAAGVTFVHDATQDTNCNASNTNVLFDVTYVGTSAGDTLAEAFTPDQPRDMRTINVYATSWTSAAGDFSLEGILRHELGHALGFLHEHIWDSCYEETWGTTPATGKQLTAYDDISVMHYRWSSCGETGDVKLSLLDAEGAQAVYGPSTFSVVQPADYDDMKGDLTNLYVGDFNGDGLDDFLRQEKGSWDDDSNNTANVFFSVGDGTLTKVTLSESYALKGDLTNVYVGDFNGDGMDDLLRQEKGAWDDDSVNTAHVLLSVGDGTFTKVLLPETYTLKGDKTSLFIGDFNGDGKSDFLRQERDTWDDDQIDTADVFLSTGNGTFSKTMLSESYDLKGDLTNLFIGDFNGDGKDDFLRQEKGDWDDDNANTANVFLSVNGTSFTKVTLSEGFDLKGDLTNLFIGDFNGDGKSDIFRQEKGSWDDDNANTANLILSIGGGAFIKLVLDENYYLKGDETSLLVGDFNGDGKSDILREEKGSSADDGINTANLWISNGTSVFTGQDLPVDWTLHGDKTRLYAGDFDGDGRCDFIRQEKGSWDGDSRQTAELFLSVL